MFVHMNITHIIDHICIINISSSSHRFCVYWIYHIHNTTTLSHHVILLPYIHHLCATSCSLFNVSISIHNSLQRERMTCIDTTHVAWSLLPRRSLSYQLHSFSDHTHIYYHQMAISWLTLFINMWKESHMFTFLFLHRLFSISPYVFHLMTSLPCCHSYIHDSMMVMCDISHHSEVSWYISSKMYMIALHSAVLLWCLFCLLITSSILSPRIYLVLNLQLQH